MKFAWFLIILSIATNIHAQTLKYIGSTPAADATASDLSSIILEFDLSDVIETHGGTVDDWGICSSSTAYIASMPQLEKTAAIYKGTKEDGELLERIAITVKPPNERFKIGNTYEISFTPFEVEKDQLYTLVVKYDFYAGKVGESTWTVDTKLSFQNNPLVISFYGGDNGIKILSVESTSIPENESFEMLPASIIVDFNYDVDIIDGKEVSVMENGQIITTASNIAVNSLNSKSIVISFPEEKLYNGHNYNIILPEGIVAIANEPNILNSEISILISGASFRTFGTGRVRPSDGSTTVMGEITIPFKFPEAEGKNYGFVAMDNGDQTPFTGYLYLGNDFSAEPVETMIGEVTSDMKGLIFRPTIVPEPETEYTLVIPEGNVKAYEIGAAHNAYLKDYISERVELHYTTPSVASLPLWQPSAVNISDGDELEHIDYFIVNSPDYEYEGTIYNTISAKLDREGGKLYEVTEDGDVEIASFNITRPTLTAESEIGNGQYIGRHFVGKVDKDLYAGKTYKLVLLSGGFVVDNPFIGHYIGNSEVSVTVKGAASTELKSEFVSNIAEGQTASHLGVVSLYTTDPVAVVEGAAIELRNGENVKSAPVRIAAEEGYSHIYADFSDADHKALALDKGVEYTVVLPQGSVAHTENENLVNNEYSVKINGLAEDAVTEYISIDLTIDDFASATYRMVKGEPTVINVKGADNWELASLTLNGTDVTDKVTEAGLYEVPALDADATLDAKFEYAEEIQFMDLTTGVDTINVDGSNYTVGKDGDYVVIYNAAKGDLITVYTVGGMQMASHVADNDTVKILLPGGIYIVRINNVTFKIQH